MVGRLQGVLRDLRVRLEEHGHRLAAAREADRDIVLEAGHLAETGSPESLRRHHGRFAALEEIKAAGWDWHLWIGAESTDGGRSG